MRVHALGCFCSCWHPGPRLSKVEGLGLIGVGAVGFKVLGAQPAGVAGFAVSVEAFCALQAYFFAVLLSRSLYCCIR